MLREKLLLDIEIESIETLLNKKEQKHCRDFDSVFSGCCARIACPFGGGTFISVVPLAQTDISDLSVSNHLGPEDLLLPFVVGLDLLLKSPSGTFVASIGVDKVVTVGITMIGLNILGGLIFVSRLDVGNPELESGFCYQTEIEDPEQSLSMNSSLFLSISLKLSGISSSQGVFEIQ
jgi:hypothetical protein